MKQKNIRVQPRKFTIKRKQFIKVLQTHIPQQKKNQKKIHNMRLLKISLNYNRNDGDNFCKLNYNI